MACLNSTCTSCSLMVARVACLLHKATAPIGGISKAILPCPWKYVECAQGLREILHDEACCRRQHACDAIRNSRFSCEDGMACLLGVAAAAIDGISKAILWGRSSVLEVLQETLRASIEGGAPLTPPAGLALDKGRIGLCRCTADAEQRHERRCSAEHSHPADRYTRNPSAHALSKQKISCSNERSPAHAYYAQRTRRTCSGSGAHWPALLHC